MSKYVLGDPIDLMKLPESLAIQILGRAVYDAAKNLTPSRAGTYRVASVDRERKVVTLEVDYTDE